MLLSILHKDAFFNAENCMTRCNCCLIFSFFSLCIGYISHRLERRQQGEHLYFHLLDNIRILQYFNIGDFFYNYNQPARFLIDWILRLYHLRRNVSTNAIHKDFDFLKSRIVPSHYLF
jgi:hypothetical protein